ncbi:MAG TPA: hypothetical protein VGF56_00105 [Rhizomicrobium sp.]
MQRAVQVIRRNWIRLLVPALLMVLVEYGWSKAYPHLYLWHVAPLSVGYWFLSFANAFFAMFMDSLLTAAVVIGVAADHDGHHAPVGEMLKGALRNFFPLLAIFALYVPGFWLAMLLLVFPAFMFETAFTLIVPARVMENAGILQCFRRSAELTKGYRWPIFGLIASYYVFAALIYFAMRPLSLTLLTGDTRAYGLPIYYIATYAIRMVVTTVVSTVTASLYFELRAVKEGIGSAAIAQIFE